MKMTTVNIIHILLLLLFGSLIHSEDVSCPEGFYLEDGLQLCLSCLDCKNKDLSCYQICNKESETPDTPAIKIRNSTLHHENITAMVLHENNTVAVLPIPETDILCRNHLTKYIILALLAVIIVEIQFLFCHIYCKTKKIAWNQLSQKEEGLELIVHQDEQKKLINNEDYIPVNKHLDVRDGDKIRHNSNTSQATQTMRVSDESGVHSLRPGSITDNAGSSSNASISPRSSRASSQSSRLSGNIGSSSNMERRLPCSYELRLNQFPDVQSCSHSIGPGRSPSVSLEQNKQAEHSVPPVNNLAREVLQNRSNANVLLGGSSQFSGLNSDGTRSDPFTLSSLSEPSNMEGLPPRDVVDRADENLKMCPWVWGFIRGDDYKFDVYVLDITVEEAKQEVLQRTELSASQFRICLLQRPPELQNHAAAEAVTGLRCLETKRSMTLTGLVQVTNIWYGLTAAHAVTQDATVEIQVILRNKEEWRKWGKVVGVVSQRWHPVPIDMALVRLDGPIESMPRLQLKIYEKTLSEMVGIAVEKSGMMSGRTYGKMVSNYCRVLRSDLRNTSAEEENGEMEQLDNVMVISNKTFSSKGDSGSVVSSLDGDKKSLGYIYGKLKMKLSPMPGRPSKVTYVIAFSLNAAIQEISRSHFKNVPLKVFHNPSCCMDDQRYAQETDSGIYSVATLAKSPV